LIGSGLKALRGSGVVLATGGKRWPAGGDQGLFS